jgi:hypothetical protein
METIEGRCRRAPHTVRTVRISFAERACQGKRTDKDSLKSAIFAMLRQLERSAVFSIQRSDRVDEVEAVAAESGGHHCLGIRADGS